MLTDRKRLANLADALVEDILAASDEELLTEHQEDKGRLAMKRHPLMQFFDYTHLPERLQDVSKPFGDLAKFIEASLPDNAERTTALQKLLEAKDCAVRAKIFQAT